MGQLLVLQGGHMAWQTMLELRGVELVLDVSTGVLL